MTRLYLYFFRGLITILPVALTLYLLYVFLSWSEDLARGVIRPFIGAYYFPGLGLTLGVLTILIFGFLVSKHAVRNVLLLIERPFINIPVIKSIYTSLKNFADYFSPGDKAQTQQVVLLRIPGQPIEIVGLVTRKGVKGLPDGFLQGDRVAVYLPMGYMIGGYTIFVPAEWVHPIKMSVEEAMRSSLIAWMAGSEALRSTSDGAPQPKRDSDPGSDPATADINVEPEERLQTSDDGVTRVSSLHASMRQAASSPDTSSTGSGESTVRPGSTQS